MHLCNIDRWKKDHAFIPARFDGERRTLWVIGLTAVVMVAEIFSGIVFGSMALLADGWHMLTHTGAFGITWFAFRYARKNMDNPAYTFGVAKVQALGGFASAVALAVVALMMLVESAQRMIRPQEIAFDQAIGVAVLGLLVNLVSALLLGRDHDHDHNLRAAYFHVLADALTSVLAIGALLGGRFLGWNILDALAGLIGSAIIVRWSYDLLRETAPALLDAGKIPEQDRIRDILEGIGTRVTDLHVWEIAPQKYAAVISVLTHSPETADYYRSLLRDMPQLAHVTIEVQTCVDPQCADSREPVKQADG